ncbi:O-antigen ligase family protein [Pontibacter chitinilyticus]|uniref:O-antigen ligase family protein n=1 Tax=Pontibacter chitinilyticus TaxID=2674989 RepID=UPI00321B4899
MKSSDSLIVRHVGLWLFIAYCLVCFHFTETKVFGVKINELVSLLTIPFLLYSLRSVNKYILYFFYLFLSFLALTFLFNLHTQFFLDIRGLTLLKMPYFISLSRFGELVACLAFAIIVNKTFNYYYSKGLSTDYLLKKVLDANLCLSLLFLTVFLLTYLKIFSLADSNIIYNTTPYDILNPTPRLRGYYVEGGPFGLFYSTFYILTFFLQGRKWVYRLVFIVVILCAQSKAGIVAVLAWHFYLFYQRFRYASWFKYLVFIALIPIFYIVFTKVVANYIYAVKHFSELVVLRKGDNNFMMGRIAAIHLIPNMVRDNPLWGIGLGNYALVRNNPAYLTALPAAQDWDAPGLGIFVTLIVENGIIGLCCFVLILYLLYRRYAKQSFLSAEALKAFALICLLGVQLHFLYIWFFIGFALAAPNEKELLNESGSI